MAATVEWRLLADELVNCNGTMQLVIDERADPGQRDALVKIPSGTTKTIGAIPLDLKDSHAHFTHLHLSNRGVVE
jgi:hypothetical protein